MKSAEEQARYPVKEGDFWVCGAHAFRCGSVFSLIAPPHDLLYSDPPWNNGILGTFYVKAGHPKPNVSWLDVYREVIGHAMPGVPIFIEGSTAKAAEIQRLLPGPVFATWDIRYSTGKAVLVYSGEGPPRPGSTLTGQKDAETPFSVLSAYSPGTVLDPCAGRGGTALCAERAGWSSVSNEINPGYVSASLVRMHKLTGQAVIGPSD